MYEGKKMSTTRTFVATTNVLRVRSKQRFRSGKVIQLAF